jgi:mono/diheme cytochrome c family protein
VQRKKRVASSLAVASLAALMLACGGSEPAQNAAPAANNANRAAAANTNKTPASNTANANAAMPAGTSASALPADVQPLFTAKCSACHGPDATGGPAAPNIFKVKDKHTADQWIAYLKNPKSLEKNSKMPPVKATEEEYKKLGAWLATATGTVK